MAIRRKYFLWMLFLSLSCVSERDSASDTPSDLLTQTSDTECDVAVVGGGPGGVHTAYRLAPVLGEKVCLFEKEARLGGRILDVSKDGGAEGPWIGVGARRVMEGQQVLFDLAQELGMQLEAAPWKEDRMVARGEFAGSSDALNVSAYPKVDDTYDTSDAEGGETETALYNMLRHGENRVRGKEYPDFRSYVKDTVGSQGYQFLTDVFRFRADFEYPLDAAGYLEYLDEEWDVCCTPSYPVGGMSEFIRRMESSIRKDKGRIYLEEPAQKIERDGSGYRITTPHHKVKASRVVLAVDAYALGYIQGDVVADILADEHFQQLIGVKVVTVTQWWPERFWERIGSGNIRRAWTTEHCMNHIEIPVDAYGVAQNVTRTVYDDDIRCVQFWEQLSQKGTEAVEKEIARGLKMLFPEVSVPKPDKTFVKIWPAGWYWQKAGSPFTNQDIARWALQPLPGDALSLVGEAYHPQRSGWSDAAYKSSIATLNTYFAMDLPGAQGILHTPQTQQALRVQRAHGRNMQGH